MGFYSDLGQLAGGAYGMYANSQAAGQVAGAWNNSIPVYNAGQDQARQAYQQGVGTAKDDLQSGLDQTRGYYDQMRGYGQPAVSQLGAISAQDPNQLTPSQQIRIDDMRRRVNNGLATSGLRGDGRAVAAAFNDVDNRGYGQAYDENQRRGDAARSTLSSLYAEGTRGDANATGATYGRIAGLDQQAGGVNATSFANQGAYDAKAGVNAAEAGAAGTTANGQVGGQLLGTLGTIFANSTKQDRTSGGDSTDSSDDSEDI